MFNENQSRGPKLDITRPAILIACSCGGLLLSVGLCSANLGRRGYSHYGVSVLGITSIALFILSILSLIAGVLWIAFSAIFNGLRK